VALAWSIIKVALTLFGVIVAGVVITKIVAKLAGFIKDRYDIT
jgi:hypothetical protein